MTGRWRSRSSTAIDGTADWARTGLVRGCITGAVALIIAGVVALAVVVLQPRAELPPGTTTSSTQTTDQAFAGLFIGLSYLALLVMIAMSVGVAVGAAIGLGAGAAAAALDALTRRTLSPVLVGAAVVIAAACAAEAMLLIAVPAWTGPWAADGRLVALLVALPFAIAGIGLWFVPVRRAERRSTPCVAGEPTGPLGPSPHRCNDASSASPTFLV